MANHGGNANQQPQRGINQHGTRILAKDLIRNAGLDDRRVITRKRDMPPERRAEIKQANINLFVWCLIAGFVIEACSAIH